jgi:hypothetical protein
VPDVREENGVITLRPGLPEHVDSSRIDAIGGFAISNVGLSDFAHGGQLHDCAVEMRVRLSHCNHEAARAPAYIYYSPDTLEIIEASRCYRCRQRVRVHPGRDLASLFDGDMAGGPTFNGAAFA